MKPAFELTVAGLPVVAQQQLLELELTDNAAFTADELSFTLSDAANNLALPAKGAAVRLRLGWYVNGEPQLVDKGEFVVDEISYAINPRALSVTARSANFRASMATVVNKSWHKTTLGAILETIAKKHKLSPAIDAGLAAKTIDHIDQQNESDGHFITRLGMQYDAVANIKSQHLVFTPIAQGASVSGKALAPVTIDISDCADATYTEADRDSQYTGAKAKWRDTNANELKWALAGSTEKPQRLKTLYASQQEAELAAATEWQKIQRGKQTLALTLKRGRAALATETPITITGIKNSINALPWLCATVSHSLGEQGYTCTANLHLPAPKD